MPGCTVSMPQNPRIGRLNITTLEHQPRFARLVYGEIPTRFLRGNGARLKVVSAKRELREVVLMLLLGCIMAILSQGYFTSRVVGIIIVKIALRGEH